MDYLDLYFRKTFTLDLRALAMLRIGLGVLLLIDLYTRATDLEAHYSNTGVLPLPVLFEHTWNDFFFSFHTGSGLWQVQALFFLAAAIFALCLILGFKTRVATIASWVFLLSVQNRNPMVLQGGDDLVRMLLFWGIFLPWGSFYSLDSRNSNLPERAPAYFSAATVAIILQIFLVYFCTALLKHAPEWGQEGTAIYYALSLDQILLPGGKLIYPYYNLLKVLTLVVYYTELLLPFLLLIPFRNSFFRMVVVLALTGLHLGISLTLFVGLFYLINMVSLLSLIPSRQMDWIEQKLLPPVSGICNRAIDFCSRQAYPFSFQHQFGIIHNPAHSRPLQNFRDLLVGFILIYTIWWNLDNTPQRPLPFPEKMRWLGYWLRVDQNWGMFSPSVFKDDGWYMLEGRTTAGKLIDLNREGKPVTYKKPESVVSLFKNDRWRKYSENYLFVNNAWMRPYYCNYLMRIWNEKAAFQSQVRHLDVVYMKEVSLDHYKTEPVKHEVLCSCGD
jgi:hypothetical protein